MWSSTTQWMSAGSVQAKPRVLAIVLFGVILICCADFANIVLEICCLGTGWVFVCLCMCLMHWMRGMVHLLVVKWASVPVHVLLKCWTSHVHRQLVNVLNKTSLCAKSISGCCTDFCVSFRRLSRGFSFMILNQNAKCLCHVRCLVKKHRHLWVLHNGLWTFLTHCFIWLLEWQDTPYGGCQ